MSSKTVTRNDLLEILAKVVPDVNEDAEANVQSDWDESDITSDAYIKNKPIIPSAVQPTETTPLMDGTADVGSEGLFARGDHVHPSDTSKQDVLVSGTNIKTINNQSLLGSGNIDIQGGGSVDSTSVPTADKVAEFDSTAHMNSTDMTAQEVDDFVDDLTPQGQSKTFEEVSVTLVNGFTVNASWGNIKAYKGGGLCVLTFSGLLSSTAVTANTAFASLPVRAKGIATAIGGSASTSNKQCILQCIENDARMYVNTMDANIAYFGQIVFPIAD